MEKDTNSWKEHHQSPVRGQKLDAQTRCQHWHSDLDIIAIKFACCGEFYACYQCHEALAGHAAQQWPTAKFTTEKAIYCGACHFEMTILEYMESGSRCPKCTAAFNPRCENHWHLYFDITTY